MALLKCLSNDFTTGRASGAEDQNLHHDHPDET
jgi:hypothetical protein